MRSNVKKSDVDTFLQACNKDKFELSVDRYVVSLYLYLKMSIPKSEHAIRQIQSVRKRICGNVSDQSCSKIRRRAKDHIVERLETI